MTNPIHAFIFWNACPWVGDIGPTASSRKSFWRMKIFRDLIYVMQGLMKADHKFYKVNGIYDFPQKQKKRIVQMKLVGALLSLPSAQKKMKGQMNRYIIAPYEKVVQQAAGQRQA
ncbi:MAG: hypothetical protein SOR61_03360 [Evtepia sp.]|nr:hypothetical protein [Evtepia sp.]